MGDAATIDLATEPSSTPGDATIDPATRTLTGPAGAVVLEPRAMQVLALLARERGQVVGRQALVDACWDGRTVGDDAINRAILKLRRSLDDAGTCLSVTTIPRVGYRLDGASPPPPPVRPASRRLFVGGGLAVAAIGGGALLAWPRHRETPQRARELFDRGEIAFQQGARDDNAQAVGFFEQAAALAPDDARIAGALALALRFEQSFRGPAALAQSTARADRATRRAVALDPSLPDTIAAQAMYLPFETHWWETERRLRAGLAKVPDSGVMNGFLGMVLAAVGRTHEAIAAFQRAVGGARFVPLLRGYLIQALFAEGRLGEVDRELDAAHALWPRFANLWWARFWTFALTGRLDQARGHLDARTALPSEIGPAESAAAHAALVALADRQAAATADAVARWAALADRTPALTPMAIGLMATLGDANGALALAERYLLPLTTDAAVTKPGTAFLFGAPVASLRTTRPFWQLCGRVRLERYWRESGSHADTAPAGGA